MKKLRIDWDEIWRLTKGKTDKAFGHDPNVDCGSGSMKLKKY